MFSFKKIRSLVSKIFTENQQMKIVVFISKIYWLMRKYFLGVQIEYPEEFIDNWHTIKTGSSIDKERSFTLYQLIKLHNQILRKKKTNLIEFGVSRGSSIKTISRFSKQNSQIFGIDSFGNFAQDIKDKSVSIHDKNYHYNELVFSKADRFKNFHVNDLLQNIRNSSYFIEKKIKFIECHFPTTLKDEDKKLLDSLTFSFCYIDFDLYTSTLDALEFIHDKLDKDAILLIDDYNFINQEGCKVAVNEFGLDLNKSIQTQSGQLIYFNN